MLNPNTTEAMTHKVVEEVRGLAGPDVEVRGATASFGHEVIASRESFAVGAQAALDAWRSASGWPDAVLLACFGDPGLEELRASARIPVAGMAEASLREAMALERPYRIVTAGAAWADMLSETVQQHGAAARLDGIVTLDMTGLAASRSPAATLRLLQDALDDSARAGGETVVLGGAGFAGMRRLLRFPGTVIDGVEAAFRSLVSEQKRPLQRSSAGFLAT